MSETATLIENIQSYMADAQELCERGAFVELAGLDGRVRDICSAVQSLSPEEAAQHAEELDKLMESLNGLQAIFQENRDALGEELGETHKHHQAAKAYAQPDQSPPKQGD